MNVFLLPTVRSSWALTPKSTGEETDGVKTNGIRLGRVIGVHRCRFLGTHPALLQRSQSAGRSGL